MSVTSTATGVAVAVGEDVRELSRGRARDLRDELSAALTERREFLRTVGVHREDGSYVVERRGADSAGHRKVFGDFEHLRRLFDRLPDPFTAEDVGRSGLTGGRRHMVLWHFVEHPAFDCELSSRQPLTAEKAPGRDPVPDDADHPESLSDEPGPEVATSGD